MPKLVISLLGSPSITIDQRPLDAKTYKATALLAYLAVNQQPHTRLELATLLWTELDKEKSLAALRTTLWKLKQAGLENWLQIRRDVVSLVKDESVEIDIIRFQGLISQCDTHGHHSSKVCPVCLAPLAEAASLYHGDFMKGFSLRDAGEFDNWQSLYSEVLRNDIRQILEKLVRGHRAQGEIERSILFARRWISYDRFNEDIHRQLMSLYYSSGQRSEAIQQYRDLVKLLHRDSMKPQPETNQLYDQIINEETERVLSSQDLETPIFLATDIENSDEMWANYREQMVHTVARYNGIVKECATQFGGHVVKQTGDTSILYFDKGQPLHCVLAIHKRLMRTTWTVNTIPRIRIALNTAEHKQPNLKDYTSDIYRTERLLSAGWGGQVLLTSQVLNVVDHPQNIQVHDLGIHMFKDLREPLRIYMLAHPALPSREFPPLQSLSNYRQNLPNYPTAFIDREMEQANLADLLSNENCRLITLIGPGGVGKTRLALQVAAQQMNNFKDGVYFVPVAAPKTPDLIPSILAQTFKYNFFEQKDPLSLIADFLREKSMLLVIDNFEHLSQGGVFLSTLLDNAPGLKIIVTSRELLNLHEEWIYEVHGLSFPPQNSSDPIEQYSAVQLFINSAQRVLAGFNPNSEDLAAIARICQIVDGIPLAIELATAWIRTLSCKEIAIEIELNLDFLSTTMRDLPIRHRSLRAVFEHSWNLLSEEGRRTYRNLAVFRGGFTADAALQVAKASPIELATFVDHSLLRRVSHGRFEIIEVLRHFAEYKLRESQEDFDNAYTMHSAYYTDLLNSNYPGMMSSDQVRSVDAIRTEIENIRAAWTWTVDKRNWADVEKSMYGFIVYIEITGHYADGLEVFSKALEKLNSRPAPELEWLQANIKLRVAWMQFCIGDHPSGIQKLQEVLDKFSQLGARLEIGIAYYFLSKANDRLNLSQLAIEQAEKGLLIFRDEQFSGQRHVRSLTAHLLEVYGLALLKLDRVKEAEKVLQESLHIHQELGQRFGSVHVLEALGRVLTAEGDISGALALRLQALKIAKDFGNKYSISILLNNLCHIYTIMNEYDIAIRYQQESIVISREIGHRWLTAIGLNNLGYIFLKHFTDYNEAIRLYMESLSLFTAIEDRRGVVYTLHDMGVAALEARQIGQSRSYFLDALNKANLTKSPELQLYVLSSMAAVYLNTGQPSTAYELSYLILSHPQSGTDAKQRANFLLGEIELAMTEAQIQDFTLRGQSTDLEQVVTELLTQS